MTHANLTQYVNTYFPLPQNASYQECAIPPTWLSRTISYVRGEKLTIEALMQLPQNGNNSGMRGRNTVKTSTSTHSSH